MAAKKKAPAKAKSMAGLKRVPSPTGSGTIRKGGLHRSLGVPQGQKIPVSKIRAAAKKKGLVGKQARYALALRKIRPKGR